MLTVIGDVHQKYDDYLPLIDKYSHTFQLGDMGFNYEPIKHLDSAYHRWCTGNHDNFDTCYNYPQNVGDWGMRSLGGVDFFFVRGAFSIDREVRIADELRTGRKSWWENEQLNPRQQEMCLAEYIDAKPSVVISHTAPTCIAKRIGNPGILTAFGYDSSTFTTDTQELLQIMFEMHEPDLHLHGHFHHSHKTRMGNTRFIGLNELETFTIE